MGKYNEPQIYVINNTKLADSLDEDYYTAKGTLGVSKTIKYQQYVNERYVNLEYNLAANLHEYKIIIIDLQNKIELNTSTENEEPNNKYIYEVKYPETTFLAIPIVMNIINKRIAPGSLKIMFANTDCSYKYMYAQVIQQGHYAYCGEEEYSVYDGIAARAINKTGKKIVAENNVIANTVMPHVSEYRVVFDLPTIWNRELGKRILDDNYIPLLKNQDNEVISYIGYAEDKGYEIVLPVCENKEVLIQKLLKEVLPDIFQDMFPESKEFRWINSDEFLPVEILQCEAEKETIKAEYEKRIAEIDNKEKEIYEKYNFLQEILTQTGQRLVDAVCDYLKWLGFENVTQIDGSEDIFREDIQIMTDEDMYIIEVKGIGGTSTDAECSQIAKHRRKREREHKDKNIIPIYIVNHQRYIRPDLRQNPPFSMNQIDYAENDERGLLTTWQLYKQFSYINNGVFTKEETRKSISKYGLISLLPENLVLVGKYLEYYKKPKAGILIIDNCLLALGDTIWANKGDIWKKTTIISIQLNGKDVQSVEKGEIGIATECELDKGYELYIKK